MRRFYSVAQHCVLAAEHVQSKDPQVKLAALLHDAAEAYPPGDILRPLKHGCQHDGVAYLREIQDRIEAKLRTQFGVPIEDLPEIKAVNTALLVTETRDLRGGWHDDEKFKPPTYQPLVDRIAPWIPELAEQTFLRMFEELATS